MRAVLQRVSEASVVSDGILTGKTGAGLLILLGVREGDTKEDADALTEKISKLRIFSDENDKLNLSLLDVGGSALVVSNFTLVADYKKGNRPSYTDSASPECAKKLYEYFISRLKEKNVPCESGVFGADMKVSLVNDGPITIVMDSEVLLRKGVQKA